MKALNQIKFFIKYRYSVIYKFFLFFAAMIIMVIFIPKTARFGYQYVQGYPWNYSNLIAPFDFAVLKTNKEITEEKQLLLSDLLPFYRIRQNTADSIWPLLSSAFQDSWEKKYGESKPTHRKNTWNFIESHFGYLLKTGIRSQTSEHSLNGNINLISGNVATMAPLSQIFTLSTAQNYVNDALDKSQSIDQALAKELIFSHLFQNVVYDEATTKKEEENRLSGMSLTYGLVQKGELIIAEGELITAERFQILESLKLEFEKQLGSNKEYIGVIIGLAILILIVLFSLVLYIILFRPGIMLHSNQILLILVSMMIFVIPESILIQDYPNYLLVLPLPLLAIIIRSFFDTRTSLFVYLLTTIIIASFVPNGYNFMFLQLITGIITIFSIHRLHKRRQFYLTTLWIFLSYVVTYYALSLVREGNTTAFNTQTIYLFAINAALTLLSYPVIYLFEKLFQQVTVITLLELSDTNNPLLRDLAHKAPGTFQHSLQVGNLAEAALLEVGGNTLLVRAGALYHDIGKMFNPLYFIENQTTQVNPHNELSYEESAEIILSHVHLGIELAKKHRLPAVIIDFIRTHHGNRRVEYFYRMALKEEGEVDEKLYTYPGPIPFSKETAVLMMADSIEAASRSIPKPDETKLNNLVDQIVAAQLGDGQFDNADITLKDINKIKKIFKKMLLTIYHIRIEYPS